MIKHTSGWQGGTWGDAIKHFLRKTGRALNPKLASTIETLMMAGYSEFTPEPIVPTAEDIIKELTLALERHYDAKARERRYDNRYTCIGRAGYPGPYQLECQAFGTWMDTCNETAYGVMAQCLAGMMSPPSGPDLISLMPEMIWPS